jgi:hypothetical protein
MPKRFSSVEDRKIARLYSEGLSTAALAGMYRTNRAVIRRSLIRTNTPRRGKSNPGSKNPAWKGGRRKDKSGYILVWLPEHPDADRHGYVREHRMVMEKLIGRRLKRGEVVHHKNGEQGDNRPENLLLFASNGDHLAVELTGKCPKWTADGLRRIAARKVPAMKGTAHCKHGTGARLLRRKTIERYRHDTSVSPETGPVTSLPRLPQCRKWRETGRGKAGPSTIVGAR